MNRKHLAASSLIFCAALVLNGCGGAGSGSGGSGNAVNNTQTPGPVANATPATNPTQAPTPPSAGNNATAAAMTTPTGAGAAVEKSKTADVPRPQIGSGGNDLFLFTQARAALGSDAELKGANTVVEVKDGVLTLSGTVATPAQKARAEQVARGIGGVKAVKNQLRVSAGG
ncbi:MAG TPA: BON domain-containing protein [Pyrinomonadaceae bacterium]|nr:BON domain-containing protein [Pyrinomonadaceae bacterium]